MFSKKVLASLANSSVIRQMFEVGVRMRAEFGAEFVFDFSLGNPDPEPPQQTLDVLKRLINSDVRGLHSYMSNAGHQSVREAIAASLNTSGANITYKNVVMTVGAGGALNVIFKALLNPGEEVVALIPYFMEYKTYSANFDAKLITVNSLMDTFLPDMAALEKAITPNTKAVIITSPNNPTGAIYPESTLMELESLLQRKGKEYGTVIYVISDEPYREIVYDGATVPQVLSIIQNSIVAYSFSKSLSLAGERIGYVAASSSIEDVNTLMDALIYANRSLGFVNAPSLFQLAIAESLNITVDTNIYRERRDLLYDHLIGLGFECVKPQGAFYLFPKCPMPDDQAFNEAALKRNIIIVPGSGFGCPGYFRLAYCVGLDVIQRSLPAFTLLAQDIGLK